MLFCLSAACAKNVSIIVTCVEYEKLYLLFSMKKLNSKDRERLQKSYQSNESDEGDEQESYEFDEFDDNNNEEGV
ncbi:11480_t:CDS:2, partial [Scutellospora calospora]